MQLEEAQQTLALRKEYDELADKITSNRLLRPREEQHANLAKLDAEIADLERESQEYAQTWAERRQQFGRIIEEGMQLRKLIRDEKEEVERKEGMEEPEDGEDERRSTRSERTTPHRAVSRDRDLFSPSLLAVERERSVRGRSPLSHSHAVDEETEKKLEEVEDEEMAEDGELEAEPESVTAALVEGLVAADGKDEGEMEDGHIIKGKAEEDHMDTS